MIQDLDLYNIYNSKEFYFTCAFLHNIHCVKGTILFKDIFYMQQILVCSLIHKSLYTC